MLKGFREFIARGSVIDLAVGVVIGAAFTALVNAFVVNVINPIIGLFTGKDLAKNIWCIKPPEGKAVCAVDAKGAIEGLGIGWGAMLSAILTFLLTALVVYVVFVVPMNKYRERHATEEEAAAEDELAILREIRDELRAQRGA